jgi:hypothetical protein
MAIIARTIAFSVIIGLASMLGSIVAAWADYQVVDVKGGGAIKGTATWKGDVPKLDPLKVNSDTSVCGATTPSPALRVDAATKGVKFVLVYLENVTQGKEPEKKYWLHMGKDASRPDSEACKFEEHVWPFVRTSTIALENYDRILHNPHGFSADHATFFNIALPVPKMETDEHFKRVTGVGLRYQCEIHTSMNGWMAGFDHPYFATTDAKGTYTIDNIPPGKYKLIAWHEGYDIVKTESGRPVYGDPHTESKDIEIKAGETLQMDFVFPAK